MTPKEFHRELLKLPHVSDGLLATAREWRPKYPFLQALPIIIALGEKQRQDQRAAESLHTAAAYSADRSLLKELMIAVSLTAVRENDIPEAATASTPPPAIEANLQEKSAPETTIASGTEDQELNPEPVARLTEEMNEATAEDQTTEVAVPPEQATAPGEFADRVMDGLGELRERMKRFNNQDYAAAEPAAPSEEESTGTQASAEAKTASNDPSDKLLDEIKSTRKRQKPETSKQVEQMELIDKFMSNKPGRRPTKKTAAEKSPAPVTPPEPPQTAGQDSYSENVISETLVDLLIRQGKREKAIEVLRKLIWKFPQKKALFAARIQELSQ